MKWRNVGFFAVMALILVLVGVKISQSMTRSVSWTRATYTDGSIIEIGNDTYNIWRQDNVTKVITQIADRVAGTSMPFDDSLLVKGRVYNFWGQTVLTTGASSDNSPIFAWTNPTGKANPPVLVVQ